MRIEKIDEIPPKYQEMLFFAIGKTIERFSFLKEYGYGLEYRFGVTGLQAIKTDYDSESETRWFGFVFGYRKGRVRYCKLEFGLYVSEKIEYQNEIRVYFDCSISNPNRDIDKDESYTFEWWIYLSKEYPELENILEDKFTEKDNYIERVDKLITENAEQMKRLIGDILRGEAWKNGYYFDRDSYFFERDNDSDS